MAAAMRVDISHETISAVTDAVLDEVMVWQNRQLDEFYPVIFLDALRIKVRDGGRVVNKSAYMAIGVDLDGIKHILGLWIAKEEGASFWAQVCANLGQVLGSGRNQAVDAPRLNSSLSISRGVAPPRICRGVSLSSFCTHATCSGVTVAKSVPFL